MNFWTSYGYDVLDFCSNQQYPTVYGNVWCKRWGPYFCFCVLQRNFLRKTLWTESVRIWKCEDATGIHQALHRCKRCLWYVWIYSLDNHALLVFVSKAHLGIIHNNPITDAHAFFVSGERPFYQDQPKFELSGSYLLTVVCFFGRFHPCQEAFHKLPWLFR